MRRWNLIIFLWLDFLIIALPQLSYHLPIYLLDSDRLGFAGQAMCSIAKMLPFFMIIGLDEDLKNGYQLNYFVRNKSRNNFFTKSYLRSLGLVLIAFLICTLTQLLVIGRWHSAWLLNLALLALVSLGWHFGQRLIEFYGNSALALISTIGFFIFGIFNRIPSLQGIRLLFGYLPAVRHYPASMLMILLIAVAVLWYLSQHFTKTRKMI